MWLGCSFGKQISVTLKCHPCGPRTKLMGLSKPNISIPIITHTMPSILKLNSRTGAVTNKNVNWSDLNLLEVLGSKSPILVFPVWLGPGLTLDCYTVPVGWLWDSQWSMRHGLPDNGQYPGFGVADSAIALSKYILGDSSLALDSS